MPKIELELTYESVDDIVKKGLIETLDFLHRFPCDDDNALYDSVLCVLKYFCSQDEYEKIMVSVRDQTKRDWEEASRST